MISWSGHYVRDPFNLNQMARARADLQFGGLMGLSSRDRKSKSLRFLAGPSALRRQSRPLARILRDVGLTRNPAMLLVLAGAAIAGMTFANFQGWTVERNPVQSVWERISDSWEQP
ncbi:MAG: hypothetical protein Fur0025_10480 [Oscillatoriaceae cyanobacterium]